MRKVLSGSASFAITLVLGIVLTASNAWSVSGVVTANETWSETVTVTGDVTVPSGITLTIAPGTEIEFDAQDDDQGGGSDPLVSELIVNGSLVAEGTEAEPIRFTSDALIGSGSDWGGIRAVWGLGAKTFSLQHCEIEYATNGIYFESTAGIHDLSILNSDIHHASQDGVYVYATSGAKLTLTVSDSTIQDTGRYGVYTYGLRSQCRDRCPGDGQHDPGYGQLVYTLYVSSVRFPERCAGDGKHGSACRLLRHIWLRQQQRHDDRGIGQRSIGDRGDQHRLCGDLSVQVFELHHVGGR